MAIPVELDLAKIELEEVESVSFALGVREFGTIGWMGPSFVETKV